MSTEDKTGLLALMGALFCCATVGAGLAGDADRPGLCLSLIVIALGAGFAIFWIGDAA